MYIRTNRPFNLLGHTLRLRHFFTVHTANIQFGRVEILVERRLNVEFLFVCGELIPVADGSVESSTRDSAGGGCRFDSVGRLIRGGGASPVEGVGALGRRAAPGGTACQRTANALCGTAIPRRRPCASGSDQALRPSPPSGDLRIRLKCILGRGCGDWSLLRGIGRIQPHALDMHACHLVPGNDHRAPLLDILFVIADISLLDDATCLDDVDIPHILV
mmetsp:Transcript_10265/g.22824  ORF Transcript_10265/g.22824 Transcript_10265/m.22824 type:complete len:218 (+) Transcript_10265:1739-2392(+)